MRSVLLPVCKRVWCLLGLSVLLLAGQGLTAKPIVDHISFAQRSDGAGYVVRIKADGPLPAYSEPHYVGGQRLELILFNTEIAQDCQRDAPAGPVQAYSAQMQQGHLYLQFHLDPRVRVDASAYRDRRTDDLLLGLSYSVGTNSETTPVRPVHDAPVITSPTGGEADLSDARQRWRLDTVVIDAGHGGHDKGAIGHNGLLEKEINLAVALKLGAYLEERLGVNVVYTRDDDRFITLRNRGKIANQAGGKLFISIHSNASHNRQAYGTETYFLGTDKTEAARRVMERENSVIKLEENPDIYEQYDEQSLIMQTLAQSAYLRSSEQLASLIEGQFVTRVGRTSRGVKQARFYVLWGASMPAVLVELGFITNPREAAFLRTDIGQDYLASAIFRAVRAFKARYEKGLNYTAD